MKYIIICLLWMKFLVYSLPICAQKAELVKPIAEEQLIDFFNSTRQVDYIFHGLTLSMSIENEEEARSTVAMLIPIEINKAYCNPIGKVYFVLKDGKLVIADLYHSENCRFLVFIDENGKSLFSATFNERGQNLINQVLGK